MDSTSHSRIALAVIATAVLVSMVWILADIPAEPTAAVEPVWRYTSEGWKELSELTPPAQSTLPGTLDNVSPLVWAALQVLIALAILICFSRESSGATGTQSGTTERFASFDASPCNGRLDDGRLDRNAGGRNRKSRAERRDVATN